MGEQSPRRAGGPGRRPDEVQRDGSPRKELAHWLRAWLAEHGDPTLAEIARGLPDDVRPSRSALAKALRGETLADEALVVAILTAAGADRAELRDWAGYWSELHHLDQHRRGGEPAVARPPWWTGEAAAPATDAADPDPGPAPVAPVAPVAPETVRTGRRRMSPLFAGALGAVVGVGVTALVILAVGTATSSAAHGSTVAPVTAAIVTPETSTAPRTFPLRGSYRNLPAGTLLWVSTFDPVKRLYFPQDKPCVTQPDGAFDCGQYYLGVQDAPDTASYRVDVIVADAAASNAFLQYQIDKGGPEGPDRGLPALPAGARTVSSRTFQREP